MNRKIILALVAGLAVGGSCGALASDACKPKGSIDACENARLFAKQINEMVGDRELHVGVGKARASGTNITVQFGFLEKGQSIADLLRISGLSTPAMQEMMSKTIVSKACQGPALDLIRAGGSFTGEVPDSDGSTFYSLTVDRCP